MKFAACHAVPCSSACFAGQCELPSSTEYQVPSCCLDKGVGGDRGKVGGRREGMEVGGEAANIKKEGAVGRA